MSARSTVLEEQVGLRMLAGSVTCVLFDFDGPLARLFAGYPASAIAQALKAEVAGWGEDLPGALADCEDPLKLVRAWAHHPRGPELEKLLTEHELEAVRTAMPTPDAGCLVRRLAEGNRRVAVTTNNSPVAAASYLRLHSLDTYFREHVHGRPLDPALMKPEPYILERAVESLRTKAPDCLMIGDSPEDCRAAERAEMKFLGYAENEAKERALRGAGARYVAGSMGQILTAFVNTGLTVEGCGDHTQGSSGPLSGRQPPSR